MWRVSGEAGASEVSGQGKGIATAVGSRRVSHPEKSSKIFNCGVGDTQL